MFVGNVHFTEVEEIRLAHVPDPDAALAEELQFEEALLASLSTAPRVNEASSSVQGIPNPKSFCEICLEDKEKWQMIENDGCSHLFCSECMSKHIISRVEANTQEVVCPGVNCSALLNASACRHLVPMETLVRWDEAVCNSMYVESQKLYCPYRDCSTMLVNDTGEAMEKSTCPLCKRSFCAACQVPWHPEFTCKEFKKLNAQGGREDAMVMTLATKKKWQKCPKCKMLVEKSEGCIHMTCRCKHQFCYRCGEKWSSTHGACQFQPIRRAQ